MSFDVIHALALRRKADAAELAQASGIDADALAQGLAAAVADGLALQARGKYVLSPAGAEWLKAQYPQVFAGYRSNPAFAEEYARFELINRELKALITAWQNLTVGGQQVPNDHSDPAHDQRVIDRLGEVHVRAVELIARMARHAPRMTRYADRLDQALARAEAGEIEWVSSIRCDSYHTVWFEMHEDLLRMLDRRREES